MPMKVKIKNYQAIKNAELNFEPGVTAIIGSSNNGKSSIIRAIEAAINNKGGSDFINYDAELCEVTIEDNGQKIIWSKNKNSNKSFYNINGQILNKIGQKQLDEVGQLLNMSEVQVNNEKFRLNFWKQLEFPFLVGKTHYQLFDFISKSKDQEIISSLEEKTQIDIKQALIKQADLNSKIDLKTQDIVKIKQTISNLEKVDAIDIDAFEAILNINKKLSLLILNYKLLITKEQNQLKVFFAAKEKYNKLNKIISVFENDLNQIVVISKYINLLKEEEKINSTLKYLNDQILNKSLMLQNAEEKLIKINELHVPIEKLQKYLKHNNKLENEIHDIKQQIKNIEQKITVHKNELESFDICPFCGNTIKNHEVHNEYKWTTN